MTTGPDRLPEFLNRDTKRPNAAVMGPGSQRILNAGAGRGAWKFQELLICFFLLFASSLMAQTSSTGALTGRVTDPTGAVVPNAMVTATSLDTSQSRSAMTDADGTYKFSLLPPGNYKLRIEASGFSTVEIPSVAITVTETAVLDRALEVGATTQTVTVEGAVETVQTSSSAMGQVLTNKSVTDLPLNTRNYTNLLTMSAGANANVTNASTLGKGDTFIATNGAGYGQNNFSQDGVDVTTYLSFNTGQEGFSGGSFALPIPDDVQEFKVQTSSADAGYGRNPGASVNVITKSGTNELHGDAFEFFRNSAMNANSFINNTLGEPKGLLNSNQFGATLGGPIKKNKLFFFTSYQETRQKNGISAFGESLPTLYPIPLEDRGSCPAGWATLSQCSAATTQFVSDLASNVCPTNKAAANQKAFQTNAAANSTIQVLCSTSLANPLANINPVAISILQLKFPNGNYLIPSSCSYGGICNGGASTTASNLFVDPATFHDHNFLLNSDYVINSKNTLSTRYQYEQDPINGGFPALNATSLIGTFLPGQGIKTKHTNHQAIAKLTSILSSTVVNQFNVAFQRILTESDAVQPFTNSQVGISDVVPGYDNLDYFTLSGAFSFGSHTSFGVRDVNNQFQANEQLSWEHGKNSMRFGVGAWHVQVRTLFPSHAVAATSGTVTFDDFLIGRASCQAFTGAGVCSSANPGNTNGFNTSSLGGGVSQNPLWSGYFRLNIYDAFIQDDIKLTPRLTVNAGLRWEYDGNLYSGQGLESSIWPSLAALVPLPGSTPQTGTLAGFVVPHNYPGPMLPGLYVNSNDGLTNPNAPMTDFAPRLGFAWQPTKSPRWVWRAGAGLFYDATPGQSFANVYEISQPGVIPAPSPVTLSTLANPIQTQQAVYPGPAGTAGWVTRWLDTSTPIPVTCPAPPCSSNLTATGVPPDMKVPVMYQWNLNTQYEFAHNWVLELAYVGSHGIHQLPQSRAGAGLQGQGGSSIGINLAPLASDPQCSSCKLTGVNTTTAANAIERVPYLGVSPTYATFETNGLLKYNAVQITVRKQLSYGLQVQANYTHAAAFDTQPFGYNTYPYMSEVYEPNNNYHPNRFVVNYLWNFPVPRYSGLKGRLLDDWSLSGITVVQDGVHLTVTDNGGSAFFGGVGSGSTGTFCPGMDVSDMLTTGSIEDRVSNGLLGGPGYLNGKTQGVLCNAPYWNGSSFVSLGPGQTAPGGAPSGFGTMGGGNFKAPNQYNWDMSLAKIIPIQESRSLQFRAEFFNAFNHPEFGVPNISANSATFGQIITMAASPRIVQLALKFLF